MKISTPTDWLTWRGWLDGLHRAGADGRWPTMKAAINLYLQRGGGTIVETGCVRQENDYGAGLSTVMFGQLVQRMVAERIHHPQPHRLITVDNNERHLDICKGLTEAYEEHTTYHLGDSVDYFQRHHRGPISLLYLDSFDYPYHKLLIGCGWTDDLADQVNARTKLHNMTHDAVVGRFGDVIDPSQEHCRQEYLAAKRHLWDGSVILIDDSNFPGDGKPGLVKQMLIDDGWELVLDYQQVLFIRGRQ